MDAIFEAVVERAFRDAVEQDDRWDGWWVEGQANVTGLVTGGTPRVQMRPDIVVRNGDDEVVFTGDAKWKTGTVRQTDIYRLTAYQLADDVPGALVYLGQNGDVETQYTVRGRYPMVVHELPTSTAVDSYGEFCSTLVDNVKSLLAELIQFAWWYSGSKFG
jgi:5-methylcytosine-specific restriction enzyme subunit McrC